MKILLVAATELEIKGLRPITSLKHSIDFLVSGIGMLASAYSLSKYLSAHKPDLIINCGVAGSFNKLISIGEVVIVEREILSELGAEDDRNFIKLSEMGLAGKDTFDNDSAGYFLLLKKYRKVNSITVNTVHGNTDSISAIITRLNPEIESMEGAAIFHVCESEKIRCIQLRGISNYVEKRNRETWNIPLALQNINEAIKELLNEI